MSALAVAFLILLLSGSAEAQARLDAEPACDATLPNGVVADLDASVVRDVFGVSPQPDHLRRYHSYGNRLLSVGPFGLGQNGVTSGRSHPAIAVGWLYAKFSWMRAAKGPLRVTGQRIDGDAPPLQAEIPDGYGEIGFQPSGLIFSTPGCWRITAQIGNLSDSKLSFVSRVVNVFDATRASRKASIEDLQFPRFPE